MTGEPTQYPFPVQPGGLGNAGGDGNNPGMAADYGGSTLRQWINSVRQPYLGSPPNVVSISGFGAGGNLGAQIINNGSDADQSQGLVKIFCGLTPGSSGTIVLRFPIAPTGGEYAVFADWAATLSLGVAGNNLTITWTANRPLNSNEVLQLAYQWAVST